MGPRIEGSLTPRHTKESTLRCLLLIALFSLFAACALAQDSSSRPPENSVALPGASGGPTAALRNLLSAACSQSENEFVRFLTMRNKESFARLSAGARVALMKRFVLLNEPGKATVTSNPSGRPSVRCETPEVTTEMQIGGADIRESIAFVPMELRDATDSTGTTSRRVTMGLVREDGEWKLLSLGLLLLDLPSLEMEWDRAEIQPNELSAIESLKKIAAAIEAYRKTYTHLPESLANLGPPLHGTASGQAAGLVDSDLATGMKNGYAFRYVIVGANSLGAQAKFELAATPLNYERTGLRSFFRDAGGVLHGADRQGAIGSEMDARVP
jgi:hypothetical protein